MKRSIAAISIPILLAAVLEAWAGPAEEVAQIAGPRLQALQD